jgi:hypothetical protein
VALALKVSIVLDEVARNDVAHVTFVDRHFGTVSLVGIPRRSRKAASWTPMKKIELLFKFKGNLITELFSQWGHPLCFLAPVASSLDTSLKDELRCGLGTGRHTTHACHRASALLGTGTKQKRASGHECTCCVCTQAADVNTTGF